MEIKITLDSPTIQERFDRDGPDAIMETLNVGLGFIRVEGKVLTDHFGDVVDVNGNIAGTWEIVRA